MTIEQKLAAVRENIARLTAIVPADQLIYRPAELQDLTLEEFKALLLAMPTLRPDRLFDRYEATGRLPESVFLSARTAKGTRAALPVEAELNALTTP